jgi:hypothetical protein
MMSGMVTKAHGRRESNGPCFAISGCHDGTGGYPVMADMTERIRNVE